MKKPTNDTNINIKCIYFTTCLFYNNMRIYKMYICSNILYKYGNNRKYNLYFNTSIRV